MRASLHERMRKMRERIRSAAAKQNHNDEKPTPVFRVLWRRKRKPFTMTPSEQSALMRAVLARMSTNRTSN
jgi:hypothetical protein